MSVKKRIVSFLLVLLVVLAIGGELQLSPFAVKADAAEGTPTTYSNVLDDLKKDSSFNVEDYPIFTYEYIENVNQDTNMENDQPLMEVIQIAESNTDELYIYVYQPTDAELDLTASAVLISTEYTPDGQNINPDIYNLELVSTESVFDKYVVKDFRVTEDPYRYYNIVTLYRNYNSSIDEVTAGGVVENFEIGIRVGQQWCAYYFNNSVVYEMNTFDTIYIKIGYTGSIEFSEGFTLGNFTGKLGYGDAWFIAFNAEDYIVNKIFDADLTYKIRDKLAVGNEVEYGEWSDDLKVTLKEDDVATYKGEGLFAKEYKWNKICKSVDFIAELEAQGVKFSDEAKVELSKNTWIFSFLQTEKHAELLGTGSVYIKSTQVSSVTVVRLHFMDITGTIYNLGVVSDRVSPDDKSDGFGTGVDNDAIKDLIEKLIAIVCIILLFVVFNTVFPFFKFLFTVVLKFIKFILNVLVWVLVLPFRMIGYFKKAKKE